MRLLLVLLAGCQLVYDHDGVDPSEFIGTYRGTVVNGPNGCQLESYAENASVATEFALLGDGAGVTLSTMGLIALALIDLYGMATIPGEVAGASISFEVTNTVQKQRQNCVYTPRLQIEGTLEGQVLSGRLIHTMLVTDGMACVAFVDCQTIQTYDALRSVN